MYTKKPTNLMYISCAIDIFLFIIFIILIVTVFGVEASNKFSGIVTPLIIGLCTVYVAWCQYNLAKKQHELAKEQKQLTEKQATISEQQVRVAEENKDIAHNKLKLELFEKRYDLFNQFAEYFSECYAMSLSIDHYIKLSPKEEEDYTTTTTRSDFIQPIYERAVKEIKRLEEWNEDKKKELEIGLLKVKFLFNMKTHEILFQFSKDTHSLAVNQYEFLFREIEKYRNTYVTSGPAHVSDISEIVAERISLARRLHVEITKEVKPFLHVPE
ncbi:hypothetical protein [Acetobacter pasteurianus]|uniref:hypothetical protein n=1 Tax=Acetobacter pasteurianus TaxID=438 RepID=UPI002491DDDD|nr:hypothetical protein [Acetobacter pasteurianus]